MKFIGSRWRIERAILIGATYFECAHEPTLYYHIVGKTELFLDFGEIFFTLLYGRIVKRMCKLLFG